MIQIGRRIVLLLLLLSPLIVFGAFHVRTNTADVAQWLPRGRVERQKYDEFVSRFGDDQFLIVSWPGAKLDDPRMAAVADELRVKSSQSEKPLIASVTTSAELVAQLRNEPARLSRRQAFGRLFGTAIGARQIGLVAIKPSDYGIQHHADVVRLVANAAKSGADLERGDIRFGGSVYEAVAIDEASRRSLTRFVIPSSIAALVVAWICVGEFRLMVIALLTSAYCQISSVALVYYLGGKLSAVLIVLPNLIFMLTLSAVVHLINYYRDAGGSTQRSAGVHAIRAGWTPCLLAALTTAIGLASLMVSDLKPVREFGFYGAAALLLATGATLLSFAYAVSIRATASSSTGGKVNHNTIVNRFGAPIASFILNNAMAVSVISAFVVIGVGWGLTQLTSSVKIERMFSPKSEIVRNYEWIESNIGPLVSVELIVSFPKESDYDLLKRLQLIAQVHNASARLPEVGGVVSALTYMPPLPTDGSVRSIFRRGLFLRRIETNISVLKERGVFSEESGTQYWRITAKVPAIHELDYGELTAKVRRAVQPHFNEHADGNNAALTITGLSPVFHEAQTLLLTDLNKSFLLAFVLIALVMSIMLRSIVAGILTMIPNATPIAIVFGLLGWTGIPLDIAGILTASVALGIAVDDTLHFVTWFSRARNCGLSQRAAVAFAYRRCATAMIQTTLICCAAMLMYVSTEFLPTRKFAILMTLMLSGAIFGDLVLFPAILAGPLGRFVPVRGRRKTATFQ